MVHTNVQIPDSRDTRDREAFHRISGELDFWRREAERLADELRNIPDAVGRLGYIEIEIDGEMTKLVRRAGSPREVRVPIDPDHAVDMLLTAQHYLRSNAPERLKEANDDGQQSQGKARDGAEQGRRPAE